jgi:hypothetical protein
MLANYPADAIYNIAFSATIGPNYSGDTFVKIEYGFVGKTFKSFDF